MKKLKYDLNDLFINTPLFNEPPLDYSHEVEEEETDRLPESEDKKGWGGIAQMILTGNKQKMVY